MTSRADPAEDLDGREDGKDSADGEPGPVASPPVRGHVLQALGWGVSRAGDELHGSGQVVPEMHVPGTPHLRTSILVAWADTVAGLLAADVIGPKVPVTLELDVHLYRPAPASGSVRGVCRAVKSGRSVFVATVDFSDEDGRPFALAAGSFMAARDPRVRLPDRLSVDLIVPAGTRLHVPFAEHAGCTRADPGVATLTRSEEALNSSNTVNGGLIALAAEEAALSLTPRDTLSSLGLRYLQPARVGPVVAQAQVRDGLGRVEVRDAGNGDRLCVLATSRVFGTEQGS
jgi:acyl-coenzyme A thioesterase PaaI-like protein